MMTDQPIHDWLITVEITATRDQAFALADHISDRVHRYDNASVYVATRPSDDA